MNWLLRQSPWLHSQNLVIVTPHLDTFLWLCKVLLWSWPWLQEFKLASVSWIAVWSGAVISRWHLTKNVSSIKNTRHFYIFFATTWLTAWFFQFGKGFVEPKWVGFVREKKRVGSDQGPTLNYASPEGQRCLEPTLAFVVQPPLPPGRSGRDRWWLLVEKRQLWCPTTGLTLDAKTGIISGTPEITSSKVQVLSRDEWPRKWGPFDFLVKKQIDWGDLLVEMIEIPMKHPCELIATSLFCCSWLGWHAFPGPIGKAGVHIVTVKVPDSCQQRSWPTSTGRCCRKLQKFQSIQVKICFFVFSFFSKV